MKAKRRVDEGDLKGIRAFVKEVGPRQAIVVCLEPAERVVDGLQMVPWREFLKKVWEGTVIAP